MRRIMLKDKIKWITVAVTIVVTLFTTCDMPMGLGPPIDTVSPNIFIDSPQDNTKMKAITQGNPVVMEGTWNDDIGVVSLQFDIIDKWNQKPITPSKTNYKLTTAGTSEGWVTGAWIAEIVIDADKATEYRIRVYALDKFGNKGMAEVNVQIDIIPPWVDTVKIQKHPEHPLYKDKFVQDSTNYKKEDTGSTSGKKDSLPNLDYYMNKISFSDPNSWRDITHEDLDEFQNESFRLSSDITSTFDNVAATRLNIYNESGRLVNEQPIKPTGFSKPLDPTGLTHLRYPYWDITHEVLKNLNAQYDSGAHYISFEIRAWSKTDWTGADDTGYPVKDPATNEEEPGRSQRIGGTVWYPESDNPNSYIDKKLFVGNTKTIRLMSNKDDALIVDLYDDDLLDEAYLGLVSKDDINTLRNAISKTEDEYFDYLAENATERTKVIAKFINTGKNPPTNLFTPIDQDAEGNRYREKKLSTLSEGEFRLIAIVKEASKSTPDYSFKPGEPAKWTVYPPIIVQVQSEAAPLIVIEKPMKENVFPLLNQDGQTFVMSGYTLSASKMAKILIAWAPDLKTMEQANAVLDTVAGSLTLGGVFTDSGSGTGNTGIKVWNVEIAEMPKEIFGAVEYNKTQFEKVFDILNDFTVNGVVENKNKLFVIRAINETGVPSTKTYRLSGSTVSPLVTVTSHGLTAYHNINNDLVLRMKVEGGADGVKLKPGSFKIIDNTGSTPNSLPITSSNDDHWTTITKATIAGYPEGSTRTYTFEAENILNIKGQGQSNIIMSDAPLIESISCAEGAGSYKIGDTLTFEVTFSMPVQVTGTPSLKLYFNLPVNSNPVAGTAVTKTASYVRPEKDNMTNVLQFQYTVLEGDNTPDKIKTISDGTTDTINLNGGKIVSSYSSNALLRAAAGKNLQDRQEVKLDGIRPYIVRAYFEQISGMQVPSFFTNGKTITLVLECSEPVLVSGSPTTYISTKTGIRRTYDASYSSKDNEKFLKFIYTVNDSTNTIPAQQLKWGQPGDTSVGPYFTDATPTITDLVGNTINLNNPPTGNNLDGGGTPDRRAVIKTTLPAKPSLSIHTSADNAEKNTGGLTGTPIKTNGQHLGMRVNGVETVTVSEANITSVNTLYYSLNGGSNPKSNLDPKTGAIRYSNTTSGESNPSNPGYLTSDYNCIPDLNYGNVNNSNYNPSSFQVTVWQTDKAGNRSPSEEVAVNINSRPAELVSMDIGLPDGVYGLNTEIPFKLFFSEKITVSNNAKITLAFEGTETGKAGKTSITIDVPSTTDLLPASSLITLKWKVPSGIATMKNIKVTDVQFTANNFTDEYGKQLTRYYGSAADNGTTRPIANNSTFNIDRADLEIRSNRPRLSQSDTSSHQTTPMIPTSGTSQNGGKIATNGSLSLVFTENANVPVTITAVPGKYITIKPYGKWAIPPELSVAEFNSVNNHPNVAGNATYRRRLSDVDDDGIPKSGSGYESGFNLYIKNTHGLTTGEGDYVRPDTETKMILDFTIDLYDNTSNNLREVFNAAEWKQQKILVTSSLVSIANNVVTVKMSEELSKGRIWEVLIEDGAFQDAAGNKSEPVAANVYRFWSEGTATPYIRADRVSYDANNYGIANHPNVARGFVSAGNAPLYPPIDTRVRIDCETPGSDIRYDVIRTSYTLKAGDGTYNTTTNTGTSTAFSNTATNNQAFFGHAPNFNAGNAGGYTTNTIGNTNTKTDGFYDQLLVPIVVETPASEFSLSNGTFAMTTLNRKGTDLAMSGGANARTYQTYNTSTGVRSWSTETNTTKDQFIYIGELYNKNTTSSITDRRAGSDTDGRLYSGRRDYIVAKAKKNAVSANADVSGPDLTISDYGMEGVYKTTVLFRDPQRSNNPLWRLLIQGFDVPVIPVVAGFPLRDANSTNTNGDTYNNYFSKSAYRYGSNGTNNALTVTSTAQVINNNGNVTTQGTNHHIWVSWEIVTDWYQKGKGYTSQTNGNYMSVTGSSNANSVLGTYGGVIYRWRQTFYP